MGEKAIGYLLITIGLVIMIAALLNVAGMVKSGINTPEYFTFEGISLDTAQVAKVSLPPELVEAGVDVEMPESNPQEIVSADLLNKTTNLFVHIFLMGFIVNVGFKISLIGANLARPVIIKMKKNIPEPKMKMESLK